MRSQLLIGCAKKERQGIGPLKRTPVTSAPLLTPRMPFLTPCSPLDLAAPPPYPVVARLAARVEDAIRRDVVSPSEPVVDVDHGARAVEEDVALSTRQARLGREPRGGLQLEGAELVHLVVRDECAPGLLSGRPVVLVRPPKRRDGRHADEGELEGVGGRGGGATSQRTIGAACSVTHLAIGNSHIAVVCGNHD